MADLLGNGDPRGVALVDARGCVTREELGTRAMARAAELRLAERSVVVLTGTTSLELVITYLALLDAGHVPLLTGGHVSRIVDRWNPAAVVEVGDDDVHVARRRGQGHPLHPDLALLLGTSGSTGSPKLVRLSRRNVASNASAIAAYLGLRPEDRGITTLPLHYCYGLSVLHSHLAAGASIVLNEASVVDPCFTTALRRHGVTNVAGVPHTFDLLERSGPERLRAPSMRFVTQAGGRMPAAAVERWLDRTEEWGVDFYVMYGQTEATARIAYLPPAIARRRPGAIGVPIPGGHLDVRPVDGLPDGVGELVYRGPNVMLGYATGPADLAMGATVDELRTGDLGRFHEDDGVFEIVGRRSRFVKPFGLRIDLDAVEQALVPAWPDVAVTGDDEVVVVAVPDGDVASIRQAVARLTGLPSTSVLVDTPSTLPRTTAGKVDYEEIRRRVRASRVERAAGVASMTSDADVASMTSVADVYAAVLGRRDVGPASTFVSLGGDSMSYVECSLRLEQVLGRLPADWHLRSVAELDSSQRASTWPGLDTTVLLRAIGICAVVATHMRLRFVPGGAHLMLAVAGYNVSRFQLTVASAADRLRAGLRTAARAAVPTVAWVAVGLAAGASYGTGTLLLVNNYVGPSSHRGDHWHFWFIEVFVQLTLLTTLLLAIPVVRRADLRFPYGLPLVLLLASLTLRLDWAQLDDWYNLRYRTHGVAWFFVLGWLVHRSTTIGGRLLTTVLCVCAVPGFFDHPQREWFIVAGLVALVWLRVVPCPLVFQRPVATVATASMWILITHFTVWPPLDSVLEREVAYVATVAAGVAAWALARSCEQAVRRLVNRRADRRPAVPSHVLPTKDTSVHGTSALVLPAGAP